MPKFKVGDEIISGSDIRKVVDFSYSFGALIPVEYKLKILNGTATGTNYFDLISVIDVVYKLNNPLNVPKTIFNIGDKIHSWSETYEIINIDIIKDEYQFKVITSSTYIPGDVFWEKTYIIDPIFVKYYTNNSAIIQGLTSIAALQTVNAIAKSVGETKTLLKSCECGAHKLGYKTASQHHYGWCPLYKE